MRSHRAHPTPPVTAGWFLVPQANGAERAFWVEQVDNDDFSPWVGLYPDRDQVGRRNEVARLSLEVWRHARPRRVARS